MFKKHEQEISVQLACKRNHFLELLVVLAFGGGGGGGGGPDHIEYKYSLFTQPWNITSRQSFRFYSISVT